MKGRHPKGKRTKRQKRSGHKRSRRSTRRLRGGAYGLPSGYEHMMAVSYTPKSDTGKLGSPDEVPTVGSMGGFLRDLKRANAIDSE
jgi:hypothetical protein